MFEKIKEKRKKKHIEDLRLRMDKAMSDRETFLSFLTSSEGHLEYCLSDQSRMMSFVEKGITRIKVGTFCDICVNVMDDTHTYLVNSYSITYNHSPIENWINLTINTKSSIDLFLYEYFDFINKKIESLNKKIESLKKDITEQEELHSRLYEEFINYTKKE